MMARNLLVQLAELNRKFRAAAPTPDEIDDYEIAKLRIERRLEAAPFRELDQIYLIAELKRLTDITDIDTPEARAAFVQNAINITKRIASNRNET